MLSILPTGFSTPLMSLRIWNGRLLARFTPKVASGACVTMTRRQMLVIQRLIGFHNEREVGCVLKMWPRKAIWKAKGCINARMPLNALPAPRPAAVPQKPRATICRDSPAPC